MKNSRLLIYFLTTILASGAPIVQGVEVLVGPVINPANGHTYFLLKPSSWIDAEKTAVEMGGHLAIIHTEAENTWITTTFGKYDGVSRSIWIGLTQALTPNSTNEFGLVYRWVNGEPVVFSNWSPEEPNNSGGSEHWAELRPEGTWNDLPNEYAGSAGLVEIALTPDVIGGPFLNPANGHVYYLLADSSWQKAERKAKDLGGHLVTINDLAENAWVTATFETFNGERHSLWIGVSDAQQEGVFMWISGEPLTFTNWSVGEPSNAGGTEHYGHIWAETDGRWNDYASPNTAQIRGVVEVALSAQPPTITAYHAIEVEWQTEQGKLYQVQYRLAIDATWRNEGDPISGDGKSKSIFERTTEPKKFYRLVPLN